MTTYKIQISIGDGSMGLVYRDVRDGEMQSLIERAATETGYTAAVVTDKLNHGSTLWLNRAEGQKIRGYNTGEAQDLIARQIAAEAAAASDGYLNDY